MLKTRLLAAVAAFAVGFTPMIASAAVDAPVYRSGGVPLHGTGVFCLNLDNTSCTFGTGTGGATATSTAADPTYTEGNTSAPHSLDLSGYMRSRVKAVAGAYAVGSAVDGWNLTLGAQADASCGTDTGTCSQMALTKRLIVQVTALLSQMTTVASNSAALAPGLAPTVSPSAEGCHVFKASPGTLYSLSGYAGQAEFIQVFNATAAPADGAGQTPVAIGYAGAAGYWNLQIPVPLVMGTGIVACASSATVPFTKTVIATNNFFAGQFQ